MSRRESQTDKCNGGYDYNQTTEEWTTNGWHGPIDMRKQVFCNRSLNMKSIVAVGFDMDYTLAQYKAETFETMAYHGTIKKLVFDLGYPQELLTWNFDWKYMVRGLILDKKRGNILKMDRHKYVKIAHHGFTELPTEDRLAIYGNSPLQQAYAEPDYALIDTLFSLAEAYLFAQLVEFRDKYPEKIPLAARGKCDDKTPGGFNFSQIYKDIRSAVDLCHRDGTLKQAVAEDPGKYINYDPLLVPMFKMLRDSGRMTFIVTNSLWDYTHVVMNYLFGKSGVAGGKPRDVEWLNYFDLVIVGSAKPAFFTEGSRAGLFEVDIKTGMLLNTDNGTPLQQVGDIDVKQFNQTRNGLKQPCKVFQGGNVHHLHRLIGIDSGSQVLYVGDHIYGDILRSKKQPGWRTMLVVPELENELELFHETVHITKELRLLREKRDDIEDQIHHISWKLKNSSEDLGDDEDYFRDEKDRLLKERQNIRELHRLTLKACHEKFHDTWGQLMKTGYQNSRFAHQVERFACLYTSQVTNICYYSPDKCYRTSEDFLPHEMKSLGF